MKYYILFPFALLQLCCGNNTNDLAYYSVEKSFLNTSFGLSTDNFNFYQFQKYLQSISVDSVFLENYTYNFDDSVVYNFLLNKYIEQGYDHSVELLSRIGQLNLNNFNDSNIRVVDLNDSISLICLGPEFTIYAMGTCCSPYQNLIIKKSGDSIIFVNELHQGKLLGVYLGKASKIEGLLFQGFSNSNGSFEGLNSTYNYKYTIDKKGIFCNEVINVRNGEPFDKNDKYKSLKDFGIVNINF